MVSLTFSDVIADEGCSVGDGFCCGVLLLKAGVKVDTGSTSLVFTDVVVVDFGWPTECGIQKVKTVKETKQTFHV